MPEPVTATVGCYSFASAAGSAGSASILGPIGIAVAVATVLGQVNKALQTAKRNRALAKHNQMIRQHDFEIKTLELKQQQLNEQLKEMLEVDDLMDYELSDLSQIDPDFNFENVDIYTIKAGDTLSGIAQNHGTNWQKLFDVNQFSSNIFDPNKILPGQTILVPKVQRPASTQKSVINPKIVNPRVTDASRVVKPIKNYNYQVLKPNDMPKLQIIDPSKIRENEKFMTYDQKLNKRLERNDVKAMITAMSTVGNHFFETPFEPEKILELSEYEKERYFKESSKKTIAILFSEFVEGTGLQTREFTEDMPITQEIKMSYPTMLFMDFFMKELKKGKIKQNEWSKEHKTIFTSPDNTLGLYQTFIAHLQVTWNLPAFLTGSLDYDYMLKGNILYLKVHNEYSFSSGVTRNKLDDLHRIKNKKCPLGNTDQYFIFTINLKP